MGEKLAECLLRLLPTAPTAPEKLDLDKPFREYGLDSMAAVGFAADVEDLLHIPASATAFWDYPTLRELAAFLETQLLSSLNSKCVTTFGTQH